MATAEDRTAAPSPEAPPRVVYELRMAYETRNMVRFLAPVEPEDGRRPQDLYVRKDPWKGLGRPRSIRVTIEPA